LRTLEDHQKALEDKQREEERRQILAREQKEHERIRKEQELAAERRKLHELQAQKVDIPPEPKPTPEPPKVTTSGAPAASAVKAPTAAPASLFGKPPTSPANAPQQSTASSLKEAPKTAFAPQSDKQQQNAFSTSGLGAFSAPAAAKLFPPAQAPGAGITQQAQPKAQQNGTTPTAAAAAPQVTQVLPDRYEIVHRSLKDLRRFMLDQAKTNAALKSRMGDMRREIRKSVGQLTHGVGNRKQVNPSDFRIVHSCHRSLIMCCVTWSDIRSDKATCQVQQLITATVTRDFGPPKRGTSEPRSESTRRPQQSGPRTTRPGRRGRT
jgi:nucleoporin GLE1